MGSNLTEVMWLYTSASGMPVGLVKEYDEIERRWKYYIGVGNGRDESADVELIKAFGQKYDNLRWLLNFTEPEEEE